MPRADGARAPACGFTLIELLVVLAIVAAMLAAVTLSVGGTGARRLENAARGMQAAMALACERAQVTGRDYGVDLSGGLFRAGPLRAQAWQPLDGASGDPLRTRAIDAGVELRLRRDGRPFPLAKVASPRPALACHASGELTPFELELRSPDVAARWLLHGDLGGTLALERIDEAG
ncbi:MAG TPA: GspH/FimT family pseudopilin [Xanthomonadaceae bacterium]|nr:GspH/FimT family pseudopilin [Xanthomonadaceae bacterium]